MQRKRLRWYWETYGANKERVVVRVSILSCYLTSMDVISVENKEKWMSCRLQQSILTWTELHTVISSPVWLRRLVRWKLAWFCCNSAITFSFVIRPTKGNSFYAEASAPVLTSWEVAFEQVEAAKNFLGCWSGGDSRRGESIDCQGPPVALLSFEKQRGLLQRSPEVNSPTLADRWWLNRQYENTDSIFHCFYKRYSPFDILLLQISNMFIYRDFQVLITTVIAPRRIYFEILSQEC